MSPFYQTHLQSQLNRADYLLLTLLVNLSIKQVKLETLATALPLPITFNSRRKSPKISITPAIDAGNNLVSNSPVLVRMNLNLNKFSMLPLTALNGDVLIY